jgi:hypothetical protein
MVHSSVDLLKLKGERGSTELRVLLGSLGDISENISPNYIDFELIFTFFNIMEIGTYTKHCALEI